MAIADEGVSLSGYRIIQKNKAELVGKPVRVVLHAAAAPVCAHEPAGGRSAHGHRSRGCGREARSPPRRSRAAPQLNPPPLPLRTPPPLQPGEDAAGDFSSTFSAPCLVKHKSRGNWGWLGSGMFLITAFVYPTVPGRCQILFRTLFRFDWVRQCRAGRSSTCAHTLHVPILGPTFKAACARRLASPPHTRPHTPSAASPPASPSPPQWLPQFFVKLRPMWMTHIANLNVLDDDNVFVYGQERYVQEALDQGKNYEQACYMPTNADAWIFGWYRWCGYSYIRAPREHTLKATGRAAAAG